MAVARGAVEGASAGWNGARVTGSDGVWDRTPAYFHGVVAGQRRFRLSLCTNFQGIVDTRDFTSIGVPAGLQRQYLVGCNPTPARCRVGFAEPGEFHR